MRRANNFLTFYYEIDKIMAKFTLHGVLGNFCSSVVKFFRPPKRGEKQIVVKVGKQILEHFNMSTAPLADAGQRK